MSPHFAECANFHRQRGRRDAKQQRRVGRLESKICTRLGNDATLIHRRCMHVRRVCLILPATKKKNFHKKYRIFFIPLCLSPDLTFNRINITFVALFYSSFSLVLFRHSKTSLHLFLVSFNITMCNVLLACCVS